MKKKVTKKSSKKVTPKNKLDVDLFFRLLNSVSPSGHEGNIRELIKKEIKPYVDEIRVDKFGNLICRERGSGKKPRIMLGAHMDEVGLIVKHIHKKGRIEVSALGGLDPLYLVGQSCVIDLGKRGLLRGVLSSKELTVGVRAEEIPRIEDLYIDTGLSKDQLESIGVTVGSYATFEPNASYIGTKRAIASKAADDRTGCFILIELAKRLKKTGIDVIYVFTVQEEVGLFGAKTSAYNVKPDWGIAVDVADAEDYDEDASVILGKGPVLTVRDSELISNSSINDWIEEVAKKSGITLQKSVSDLGTTDATNISLSRGGVPSTAFGVCIRNMHSAVSVVSLDDVEQCIQVLYDLLLKHPKSFKIKN